jgi:low temperature requirement protein LtrA
MSVSDGLERDEHEVTPLELFFDLTFVFAMTQVVVPALAALALVSAVCTLVVAYEVLRYRAARVQVRHPELA